MVLILYSFVERENLKVPYKPALTQEYHWRRQGIIRLNQSASTLTTNLCYSF